MNKSQFTNSTSPNGLQPCQNKQLSHKAECRYQFFVLLDICKEQLDFQDEQKDVKEKRIRAKASNNLLRMIQMPSNVESLFLPNFDKVLAMIEANIFRPLPHLKITQEEDDDVDGIDMKGEQDPQWPYLQDTYELFLKLVQMRGVNQNVLQHHISDAFIYRFLDLFNSQMTSEREYLL